MDHRHSSPAPASHAASKVFRPLERFLRVEAASGVVLLASAVTALIWANSPWASSYDASWHAPLTIGFGALVIEQPLHFWINDGLMTIFFLVVGLEIRRELHEGALSNRRAAALPLIAALGGILLPAALYIALNIDPVLRRGWAVPTATDIAFAVGVLALLGGRVPQPLRVLLLSLAIIDDIAAIIVIALFYSGGIEPAGLAIAGIGVAGVLLLQRLGARNAFAYALPGCVIWIGLLHAHVHPTLAGVILGLLTPVTTARGKATPLATAGHALDELRDRMQQEQHDPHDLVEPVRRLQRAQRDILAPVVRVEAALHPWVAFGIMPLFALANAGVAFDGPVLESAAARSVALGIGLALVLGKPIGILLAVWLALKSGIGELSAGITWRGVVLVGCLGGIGFTMSLFIANLAFADTSLLASAKIAVLAGSTVAGLAGFAVGRLGPVRSLGTEVSRAPR